jgi:hypothetical protein
MIRARAMLATLAAATSLAGCTMLGGYGGVSIGSGQGHYDDDYYGDPYYGDPYYGSSYYGWYDDFYYPGLGAHVYDRGGQRHGWNDKHRRHWEARRAGVRDRRDLRENWSDYRRDRRADNRDGWREDRRDGQEGRRDGWRERGDFGRDGGSEQGQSSRERRTDGPAPARSTRSDRREAGQGGEFRRDRRADAPPSASATPRGGSDTAGAPRPQMEARPMPQAVRPEPRQERIQSPSAPEELAPRHPE